MAPEEDPLHLLDQLRQKVAEAENLLQKKKRDTPGQKTTEALPLSRRMNSLLNKKDLLALCEIQSTLTSRFRRENLLEYALDSTIAFTKAERGFLLLATSSESEILLARNMEGEDLNSPESKISQTVLQKVIKEKKILSSFHPTRDKRLAESLSLDSLKVKALLCLPLRYGGEIKGVLYLDRHRLPEAFSPREKLIAQTLAQTTSFVLSHIQISREKAEKARKIQELNRQLQNHIESQTTELEEVRRLLEEARAKTKKKFSLPELIGQSPEMEEIYERVEKVRSLDLPVLVQGESGTGKELIARALHFSGDRRKHPFLSENCALLSKELLESELFGHRAGAFTGANRNKTGLLVEAGKGTIFLDEVGEMSLEVQKKLLRALQEYEVRPLGGSKTIPIKARVITATNRNLKEMVREGTFREDLYYRLRGVEVNLPPLRQRGEDILLLARHFLDLYSQKEGKDQPKISRKFKKALTLYPWPGNVRELENEMKRLVVVEGSDLGFEALSPHIREYTTEKKKHSHARPRSLAAIEKETITAALKRHGGNKSKAANELEINRSTLYAKMRKYGIQKENL